MMRTDGVPVTGNIIIEKFKDIYCQKYSIKEQDYNFLQLWAKYSATKGLKPD